MPREGFSRRSLSAHIGEFYEHRPVLELEIGSETLINLVINEIACLKRPYCVHTSRVNWGVKDGISRTSNCSDAARVEVISAVVSKRFDGQS